MDGFASHPLGFEPNDIKDPLMSIKWGETLDLHFRKTAVCIHAFIV